MLVPALLSMCSGLSPMCISGLRDTCVSMLWLTGVSLITQPWFSQDPSAGLGICILGSLSLGGELRMAPGLTLAIHNTGKIWWSVLCWGIGCSSSLHTIFLPLPESFLFSSKGFREYPNHEKIKGKVRKKHKKERLEKPGNLDELMIPRIYFGMEDFPGCGDLSRPSFSPSCWHVPSASWFHSDDAGKIFYICAWITFFFISVQWSPVSPEYFRFHFPSNSVTVNSDSWSMQNI